MYTNSTLTDRIIKVPSVVLCERQEEHKQRSNPGRYRPRWKDDINMNPEYKAWNDIEWYLINKMMNIRLP
jgi:hypothetical protein